MEGEWDAAKDIPSTVIDNWCKLTASKNYELRNLSLYRLFSSNREQGKLSYPKDMDTKHSNVKDMDI